jgi:hypothetical protein
VKLAGFLSKFCAVLRFTLLGGGGSGSICAGAADGAIRETGIAGLVLYISMKKGGKTSDQEIYVYWDYLQGVLMQDFQTNPRCAC